MKYTPRIEQAIRIASSAHRKQTRKGDEAMPYISHLFSVLVILSEYTDDEDVLIAGLLHDVLEDADPNEYTKEKLAEIFGGKVASIVLEVSEQKDGSQSKVDARNSWQKRKEEYLEHLQAISEEALLVSTADKLHSILSLMEDSKHEGPTMWSRFNAPKEKQLWFYKKFAEIAGGRLKNSLGEMLNKEIVKLETVVLRDSELRDSRFPLK
ncbi:MAG: HD domain-containing protein [Candidatus Gracilibacteria bacterium]|jgi:(p)ppGpp synthase/HD superfamily hydrolase